MKFGAGGDLTPDGEVRRSGRKTLSLQSASGCEVSARPVRALLQIAC